MPKVWSYCGLDWVEASRQAGGVEPITCPPDMAITVDLKPATKADIVYLNLHGYAGQPYLYGQSGGKVGPTALTAAQIEAHRWDGIVVFAEVCWSAVDGGGDIARAFLDNGAKAFIGSTTEAYGRIRMTRWLDGEADRLMQLFRFVCSHQGDPAKALDIAKRWLRLLSWPLDKDDRATLESFICLEAKTHENKT